MATMDYSKASPFNKREGDFLYGTSDSFVSWGDSLTAADWSYWLALALGKAVHRAGVGGESSKGIAARQGALPYLLTPVGGVIPASGPVNVTIAEPANVWPLLQGSGIPTSPTALIGDLAGVKGSLTLVQPTTLPLYYHHADDYYVFTRATAGTAVTVNRPQPFVTDFAKDRKKDIAIFWVGRNNHSDTNLINDIEVMLRNLDSANPRFLIVSIVNGRFEGTGSSTHTSITGVNNTLAAKYGRRFVDLRKFMVQYGMTEMGIPINTSDQADIDVDTVPSGLRSDAVHHLTTVRPLIANVIAERLYELGWVDSWTKQPYAVNTILPRTSIVSNENAAVNTTGWTGQTGAVVTRETTDSFFGMTCFKVVYDVAAGSALRYNAVAKVPVTTAKKLYINARVKDKSGLGGYIRGIAHCYLDDVDPTYLGNVNINTSTALVLNDWVNITTPGGLTLPANTTRIVMEFNKAGGIEALAPTVFISGIEVWQE